LTFLKGVVLGSILAAVYAFANYHNPIVYLNVLLCSGFGSLLGWFVAKDVRRFHIRGVFGAGAIALAVCAISTVVHWFFYVATVVVAWGTSSPYDVTEVARAVFLLVEAPSYCWELILLLNETGVWSLGRLGSSRSGLEIKGLLLAAIWAAEALVLLWFSLAKPMRQAGMPYSERGQDWIAEKNLPKPVAFIKDPEGFKSALARGDYSALTRPPQSGDEESGEAQTQPSSYAVVTLYSDLFEPYVSVKNVSGSVKQPKKSRILQKIFSWLWGSSDQEESFSYIVRYLKISPTVAREIESSLGSF
jgi:hypothetical protein